MGPGSFGELWRYIEPTNIDAAIFSHCHADHMGDVISLHVYRRWGPGAYCDPMVLAGPACLPGRVRQIDGAGEEEDYSTEFIFKELSDTQTWDLGPFTVSAARAWHSVPAFGIRISGPSGFSEGDTSGSRSTFFYTGDTDLCDSIVSRVILTHIQPWNNPEATRFHAEQAFGGRVELATTGLSVDF